MEIQELTKADIKKRDEFLISINLQPVETDYAIGIFDNEQLIATGGYQENIIKGIGVDPDYRDLGLMNQIISHLYSKLRKIYNNLLVFTKSNNVNIFKSFGFNLLAKTDTSALLESQEDGIDNFIKKIPKNEKENGAIVINGNPITLGHLFLIKKSAELSNHLYIFVVQEDLSWVPFIKRFELIKKATEGLSNITVVPGGPYIISKSTFPTYFLKQDCSVTKEYAKLDATLFASKIASKLNISKRFVGTEQNDIVTAEYNEQMKTIFPYYNIKLVEIQRLETNNFPISASKVRALFEKENFCEIKKLVPSPTYHYLISRKISDFAYNALVKEVKTTPKPGLVDCNNNGAHKDMNLPLFLKSADAIKPYFEDLVLKGFEDSTADICNSLENIRKIGLEAEKRMFLATSNVNTHKGAIFSLGLFCYAVGKKRTTEVNELALEIKKICENIFDDFNKNEKTNGNRIFKETGITGIRGEAKKGFVNVLKIGLNSLKKYEKINSNENFVFSNTLMELVSKIDDTTVINRVGIKKAIEVKRVAEEYLSNPNINKLKELDDKFIEENISPGGAADLLGLTIFIDSIKNIVF